MFEYDCIFFINVYKVEKEGVFTCVVVCAVITSPHFMINIFIEAKEF